MLDSGVRQRWVDDVIAAYHGDTHFRQAVQLQQRATRLHRHKDNVWKVSWWDLWLGRPSQGHQMGGCRFRCWQVRHRLLYNNNNNNNNNKKHLKNVGPIRHCEPPHAVILHCYLPGVATVARRHCCTPPTHRCPRRRQQRQRVTEGTAMAP